MQPSPPLPLRQCGWTKVHRSVSELLRDQTRFVRASDSLSLLICLCGCLNVKDALAHAEKQSPNLLMVVCAKSSIISLENSLGCRKVPVC